MRVSRWTPGSRPITRAHPYAGLDRALLDSVVELLTGAYPSADFGELRARLVLGDDGRLYPRPGALRLAATSGGTIPDRGMFGVFLATDEQGSRRVGELDEEMVYESRVGDVFTLGASAWQIQEITRDQVRVIPGARPHRPAPVLARRRRGAPGRVRAPDRPPDQGDLPQPRPTRLSAARRQRPVQPRHLRRGAAGRHRDAPGRRHRRDRTLPRRAGRLARGGALPPRPARCSARGPW